MGPWGEHKETQVDYETLILNLKAGERMRRTTWPANRYVLWVYPDVLSISRPVPRDLNGLLVRDLQSWYMNGLQVSDGYILKNADLDAENWERRDEPGNIG